MSADLNMSINMRGTPEELLALLRVLKIYETEKEKQYQARRDCGYIDWVTIQGSAEKSCNLMDLSDDDLQEFVASIGNRLLVKASGPWGAVEPRDVGLVEALAEAAPTAFFDSYVSGSVYEERIEHSAELIKGKLYLTYVVEESGYDDNDEEDEESGSVERSVYDPITKEYHQREASTPSLWGRVFVILDQVNQFQNASKLTAYIESLGGKVDKEYTFNADYIVCNNPTKAKRHIKKIEASQQRVFTEEEFIRCFGRP